MEMSEVRKVMERWNSTHPDESRIVSFFCVLDDNGDVELALMETDRRKAWKYPSDAEIPSLLSMTNPYLTLFGESPQAFRKRQSDAVMENKERQILSTSEDFS